MKYAEVKSLKPVGNHALVVVDYKSCLFTHVVKVRIDKRDGTNYVRLRRKGLYDIKYVFVTARSEK